MTRPTRRLALTCLGLLAGAGAPLAGQATSTPPETAVTTRATGTFDVQLTPQTLAATNQETGMGRMLLVKQFHGDLDATSTGEMLTGMGAVQGSAGYVAIERVSGTLRGRRGSFLLQHTGTMDRGLPTLAVHVIPDSGTDGLTGLTGTLTIRIAGSRHEYDFDYTLPAAP